MSELKAHKAYNRWIDDEMPTPNEDLICNEVYLKSEADKVIAELENETERLKKQSSCKFSDDCLRMRLLKRELRHQKYKRCLAMSSLCHWKMGVFIYKKEKNDFYYRWYRRWRELAEKFKDKEA